MLPGFEPPIWTQPLDVNDRIAKVPANGRLRGVFFQVIVDALATQGKASPTLRHYAGFSRYPLREYLELSVAAAKQLYPNEPIREGLRRIGHAVYPAFKNTMAGSAIFSFANDDFSKVSALAQKAYSIVLEPSDVSIRELEPRHIVVHLREVYNFPDCLQIGVWEGAMAVCGVQGDLYLKVNSTSDVELEIQWR